MRANRFAATPRRLFTQCELFRLQGVPDGRIQRPWGVSVNQLTAMIGNAFSVSVFQGVFANLLVSAGLTK